MNRSMTYAELTKAINERSIKKFSDSAQQGGFKDEDDEGAEQGGGQGGGDSVKISIESKELSDSKWSSDSITLTVTGKAQESGKEGEVVYDFTITDTLTPELFLDESSQEVKIIISHSVDVEMEEDAETTDGCTEPATINGTFECESDGCNLPIDETILDDVIRKINIGECPFDAEKQFSFCQQETKTVNVMFEGA
jgi:hypothetical protein